MEEKVEKISPVCYEAIRSWQVMNGESPVPHWYSTTKETRDLMRDMVRFSLENKNDLCAIKQFNYWIKNHADNVGYLTGVEANLFARKEAVMENSYERLPCWQQHKFNLITCITKCLADN